MSGAQTIVLGYTPDGTVLVPPNSPVTVQGSSDIGSITAALAGTFAPVAEPIALTKVPLPSAGDPVGGVPTKQSGGTVTYAVPPNGGAVLTIVDNGDGTVNATGSALAVNADGTADLTY